MNAVNTTAVRLLDTQTRGHIGSRLLHRQPNGELIADAVWRWASLPNRYLDTALRLALASSPDLRFVDAVNAPTLSVTLLAWHLESESQPRLVGALELSYTGIDHAVYTYVLRDSEPVTAELPGDLSAAAGRLLQRMASETLARAAREPAQPVAEKP